MVANRLHHEYDEEFTGNYIKICFRNFNNVCIMKTITHTRALIQTCFYTS